MKRILTSAALVLLCCTITNAQKKPLDHTVYDSWQSALYSVISNDGRFISYVISPQEGDNELVITNITNGEELRVPRGGAATISEDSKWAAFTIKAPFAATREAKIRKKKADEMPKDSIGYVNLETLELKKFEAAGLKTTFKVNNIISYTSEVEKVKMTILLNPATGHTDTLKNVGSYAFDTKGQRLAVVFKKDKKDSLSKDEAALYQYPSMQKFSLSEGKRYYSLPEFNDGGDKAVFLASSDSNATGNKHCAVFLYEEITTGKGKKAVTNPRVSELLSQEYTTAKGLSVTENSRPVFSKNSTRILLGVSECQPPKDTTIVDFETAQLDVWNYDIYMTPPIQKARLSQLKTATNKAVISLKEDAGEVTVLTDDPTLSLSYIDGAENDLALLVDSRPYMINSTWDSNSFTDVYLVSLRDGSKTLIKEKLNGRPTLSPNGKYLAWFSDDDLNWHTYRIADGVEANVTAAAGVPFYDEEDDHPDTPPTVDRPHWIGDDEAFLLSDKYDIWKFTPDGKSFVNLTQGEGRKKNLQLSYENFTKSDISPALSRLGIQNTIGKKEVVYLTVFDRSTKENGYATVAVDKPGIKSIFTAKKGFLSASKAKDADIFIYRIGDFNHSADVYTSTDGMATGKQWSHINPQQADYNWGNIQLVHWKAYDGTALDGLLVTPEDLDPAKKYPMMIYFYERNSETLYSYRQPAPSASTVNIPFFASRGYVVFIPDIVYKDGHPGESAYNCICSGAEAMCEQFSFVDKSRMAIQGQSWGGYQTAYLITRTNMFAAAGAGAPVGNMTSAYGGIRWESGAVRAMQYEHGQSRIGKSLWDEGGLDLYIENSPIFHTQNVTTPTLIMHNDADGAVPWWQGIEFFMALRRFHHPAWLLQYNNEAHNLMERKNRKDLSIRLQQFFDHYLKGDPMPAWMATGIPMTRKGEYFGFEYAE